jgi:large subunit ribosomal protein L22
MDVRAKARFVRMSAQKARLVVDLIRGKQVEQALSILHFTKKRSSKLVEKVLKSAIANAQQRYPSTDVDNLYVKRVFVDQGPTLKRVRPAPMGRAYRVLHRLSHITVELDERAS